MFNKSAVLLSLLVLICLSCEYGPKHGKMNLSQKELKTILDGKAPEGKVSYGIQNDIKFNEKPLKITRHAKCRMQCRYIDAEEVQDIIDQDRINERKSETLVSSGQCPTIAYEGFTKDKQHVRVIVGDCKDQAKLITVIDLENEYECDCEEI